MHPHHETVNALNQATGNHIHPILGSVISVALFVIGMVLGQIPADGLSVNDVHHIPPIFIESLQVLALTGSIIVATLTARSIIRKGRKA